jgi:hypothetical protein
MRSRLLIVILSLISFQLFSQGYIQIDTVKYYRFIGEKIDGLNLENRGRKLVDQYDSSSGQLNTSLYINIAKYGSDYIIYLRKKMDSEDSDAIIVDQFRINSNLKYLYLNGLGCSSIGGTFGAFSIQGGNS